MEICKCSTCSKFSFLDKNHQRQSGCYLSVRNAAKHRFADIARVLPSQHVPSDDDTSATSIHSSPSTTDSEMSMINEPNPLPILLILFVSWLHLFCHVSRENCKIAIQMIINILSIMRKYPESIQTLKAIPRDPRTLIKRAQLDVEVTEFICCRTCFRLYELKPTTPIHCTYKPFKNSYACNEELFINKKFYRGYKDYGDLAFYSKCPQNIPKNIATPRCVYISQPILTWVKWLLSKPDTEQAITDWTRVNQDLWDQGYLSDIQHGENFTNTSWKNNQDILKLGLSLFVDWFNPRGNKISGKVESTGILALSCLNLPPSIRNKLSHMCLAGITPGPYSPNPETFNHLLIPLVDELVELNAGVTIPTHQFPAGRFVQVKLLCVYGDVLATKKVVGYASHSATKFCSFCHAEHRSIPSLQLSKRREKSETITAANEYQKAASTADQEKALKKTGVRWSELNRLAYWDPSRHVVLGVMHNWLEGILQGHFRYRWKFWAIPSEDDKKKRKGALATSATYPNKRLKTLAGNDMEISEDEASDGSYDEDNFEDIGLNGGLDGSFFSQDDIKRFRLGMKEVVLPPGIPHLPANLGEAKHGKLSASQWHALFVFIIPLVILDMYLDNVGKIEVNSNLYKFLANTAHLVQCTNVIFARKFKPGDMTRFDMHYKKYSDMVGELFEDITIWPNHHFSLHIPQQMAAWGPLAGVSEFPGERLIGFLQKIKTNNKIDEMHRSMMTHGCQLQRMMDKPEYCNLSQDIDDSPGTNTRPAKPIILTAARYQVLFNMVSRVDRAVIHREVFPVPRGCRVLLGSAKPVRSLDCNGTTVGAMSPRDCVVFAERGKSRYGLVRQCYQYENHLGEQKAFLVISKITNMYAKRIDPIPTRPFRYLLFLFGAVVGRVENTEEAIDPSQIESLAAYRLLEKDTFSISTNGIALIPKSYDAFLNISGQPT